MSIQDYKETKKLLRKYNIKDINIYNKSEIKQIDFREVFNNFNANNFSLKKECDAYLKKEYKARNIYKNNIYFQIVYMLLSDYTFKNKNIFIDTIQSLYDCLIRNDLVGIEHILGKQKIEKYYSSELTTLSNKINSVLENYIFIQKYQDILNDESEINNLKNSNFENSKQMLYETIMALLVHNGDIDLIENVLKNNKSIKQYSIDRLIEKVGNNKLNFLRYMNNYYKNAFFFHGTNSFKGANIKETGLNGLSSFDNEEIIIKTNNILEKYGLYRGFEGKHLENKCVNYYVTDCLKSAIYYADQSPEYLSRFCANGHIMENGKYDHEAFWRRDYNFCISNIHNLCIQNKINRNDTMYIEYAFNKLWESEVNENQTPIIYIGKIDLIEDRDDSKYKEVLKNINNMSYNDIYDVFTKPNNVHNNRFASINEMYLSIIKLPNIYKLYTIKPIKYINERKYIKITGKRYYPDLVIYSNYSNPVYIVIDNNCNECNDKHIVFISSNQDMDIAIENNFYIENIKFLLINKAIPISNKGNELITSLTKDITFSQIFNYYKMKTKLLINEYKDEIDDNKKISIYNILANNIFYTYYAMLKTDRIFKKIDSGFCDNLHYEYDITNYWYRATSEHNVNINYLDDIVLRIEKIYNKNV